MLKPSTKHSLLGELKRQKSLRSFFLSCQRQATLSSPPSPLSVFLLFSFFLFAHRRVATRVKNALKQLERNSEALSS